MKTVKIELSDKEYRRIIKASKINTKDVRYRTVLTNIPATPREKWFRNHIVSEYGWPLITATAIDNIDRRLQEAKWKKLRRVK